MNLYSVTTLRRRYVRHCRVAKSTTAADSVTVVASQEVAFLTTRRGGAIAMGMMYACVLFDPSSAGTLTTL